MTPQYAFVFRQYFVTTPPIAAVEFKRCPVHPVFVLRKVIVCQTVRFARRAIDRFIFTRDTAYAVPYVIVIPPAPVNSHRGQVKRIRPVDQTRRKQHGTVGIHIEFVYIQIYLHGKVFSLSIHVGIFDGNTRYDSIGILSYRFWQMSQSQQDYRYEYCSFHVSCIF